MCYEQEGDYIDEDELCMSPLNTFFNIQREEGESAAHLFLRMARTYWTIPLDIRPECERIMQKFYDLEIAGDPSLELLLEILKEEKIIGNNINNGTREENFEQLESEYKNQGGGYMYYEHEEIQSCVIEEEPYIFSLDMYEEEDTYQIYEENNMEIKNEKITKGSSEHYSLELNKQEVLDQVEEDFIVDKIYTDNEEHSFLSTEQILDILGEEYQKYTKKCGCIPFSNYQGDQV